MKAHHSFIKLTIIVSVLCFDLIYSQQDINTIETLRIKLSDGSTIIGDSLSEDENFLTIKTLAELEIRIPKENITEIKVIKGHVENGEFWNRDPNKTRMYFAPTGKSLESGDGYFAVYELFFPFLAVGVTDWFTLAGGMSLLPGADEQLFYIAPKITPLQGENFNASFGTLYLSVLSEDGAGILYAVGTYENERADLTIGLGYGYSGEDFADKPIILIGGSLRISKVTKLLTENWIITSGNVNMYSIGLRFFGESLAADFGLVLPSKGGSFVPWLGFGYNF